MPRNRSISEIVWPENRDETFLAWLAEDAALLCDAGFSTAEAKSMLLAQKYVQIWSINPRWLFPVKSLPKGYHWRDGQKFSCKRRWRYDGESYVFLPVGEDLYIKGMPVIGTKDHECSGARIKNFRDFTCADVIGSLRPLSPFLDTAFHTFWHSQGLNLGYVESDLRPFTTHLMKAEKPP